MNISSVSVITTNVGCYDSRGYDGNASQHHPPRVKTPDDTADEETSSSKRATLTAVGIVLGVLLAIGFAVAVTFAVSKDSDNKVEANLTTSGVSMTSYLTTTPSVTSHESTTHESITTSQAGATTDYLTHVTSRVTTIQGTHASETSVTSQATTTLQHITTLQGVTTSTSTIMSTTGSTDHSTTSGCPGFLCTNGTCLPMMQRCDVTIQCPDGKDEMDCLTVDRDCDEEEFRCIQYRQCVPGARRCDGTPDCLDGSDEWYDCNKTTTTRPVLDLEIRLMDGQSDVTWKMRRGRVEARLTGSDDEFGTVCGDTWTDKEATVVCRSLYTDFQGTGFAYGNAIFGQGSGDVLMWRVQCHGNETNLGQCWSRGIGPEAVLCGHSQDASVSCDGPLNVSIVSSTPLPKVKDIRLSRGKMCLEGLVQVNHDGEWRAVCDDGFGEREATVVCRMLGFNAGIGKVKSGFGIGDGLFWLDDVSCYGNETNIMQCQSRPLGENNCDYYEAVGVACPGNPEIDCAQTTCVSSVNCSFDEHDCCYDFADPSVTGVGAVPWVWKDHPEGAGRLVSYFNPYGGPRDYAVLTTPSLPRSDPLVRLQFRYKIQGSDTGALSVLSSLTGPLWTSDPVPAEVEAVWLRQCVQIKMPETTAQDSFQISFVAARGASSSRDIMLDDVTVSADVCGDCADGFACVEQCINNKMVCDRRVDCAGGEDENETTCGFKADINFNDVTNLETTGYSPSGGSLWTLERNKTVTVAGERRTFNETLLYTEFTEFTLVPRVIESFEYHLDAVLSCLEMTHFGDAADINVTLTYKDGRTSSWVFDVKHDMSHLAVPVFAGNVRLRVAVTMVRLDPRFSGRVPELAVFALRRITLHRGTTCSNLTVECPASSPNFCSDRMSCYADREMCNLLTDCQDGSDETEHCGFGIECDFEHVTMCGYRNSTSPRIYWDDRKVVRAAQTLWTRTASSSVTRPTTDHNFGNSGRGHFMTSKNHEGVMDALRYVDVETMTSPPQTFDVAGCVTFWYYLNSSNPQPHTTSAQLWVSLQYEDTRVKELLWTDHVNREIAGWLLGGIPVPGQRPVRLVVTGSTFIPYDSYTGAVSFDDVKYAPGPCNVTEPVCDSTMFRCPGSVCLPGSIRCDGQRDCPEGEDELHCDWSDGALTLAGGDGSYGRLGYFRQGSWRPVCFPTSAYQAQLFIAQAAQYVCRKLGFSGNSDAAADRMWGAFVEMSVELSCDSVVRCNASAHFRECEKYAFVRCSNQVCFQGERLCPGTVSKCVPRSRFCDGQSDCPENADETNCYCDGIALNSTCNKPHDVCTDCVKCADMGGFECQNHKCIPLAVRCDSRPDCLDGTDEYQCVQVSKDGHVTAFFHDALDNSHIRRSVCADNVTRLVADRICVLAGQGTADAITTYSAPVQNAVTVIASGTALSGLHLAARRECFPVRIQCRQPVCGTRAAQDTLVAPYVLFGQDARVEDWPWTAVLIGQGYLLCTAVVIHPEWVLTAAHCLHELHSETEYSVVLGVDSVFTSGDWIQTIRVTKIYETGYIDEPYHTKDIAILRLEHPALLSDYTRPVCLPSTLLPVGGVEPLTSATIVYDAYVDAECYVTGHGATEDIFDDPFSPISPARQLQRKRVHLVQPELCRTTWLQENGYYNFPSDVICIASEGPGAPTCFGDSGGPLVCRRGTGNWELLGIISFGFGNCLHDVVPSVTASVPEYYGWITDVTDVV